MFENENQLQSVSLTNKPCVKAWAIFLQILVWGEIWTFWLKFGRIRI